MKKLFTLKTRVGCVRFLILCLCVIFIFSFIAQYISSDGASIKIEEISIDARGATLSGDLYYPAGVTDRDSLPAVVFAHGAGVTKDNYRGIVEELARRGFVVFNINGYGTGYSEMPVYDESNMGIENYVTNSSSSGTLDALEFVRTLKFVDPTRIGLAGHSQGSRRMEIAATLDNGYLTLNDIMLNVLYEDFGKEISEEELSQDADVLAESKLSSDELPLYNYIKAEKEEWFNTRAVSLCLIGSDATNTKALKEVEVAGHTVLRNVRINRVVINGAYDRVGFYLTPDYTDSYYATEELQPDKWYTVDDLTQSTQIIGDYPGNLLENPALQEAIAERTTRLFTINVESHSKNFFSEQTASDVVKYFEQTLMYNNGDLGSADATPLAAEESHFVWREICNAIAMFAMLTMLMPLTKLICGAKFFSPCMGETRIQVCGDNKKRYWIVNILAVVFGVIATLILDKLAEQPWMYFHATQQNPLFFSWWMVPIFLSCIAVFSLGEVVVLSVIDKKKIGAYPVLNTNIKLKVVSVLKSLLLAIIVILIAYASLSTIMYLFNQDYRLWMFALPELRVEHWMFVIKMGIIFLPETLLIGLAINYAPSTTLPEWLDDLLAVLFNSLGLWLVCLVDILLMAENGCKWTFTYGYIFSVPIVSYMTRRMFKATKNVWIGATISALLLAWLLAGTMGYDVYYAQGFGSIFFNA